MPDMYAAPVMYAVPGMHAVPAYICVARSQQSFQASHWLQYANDCGPCPVAFCRQR